jgi:hypothetical protein
MKTKSNPLARRNDVVVQELQGEVLIYNLQNNKAFCLNETSAMVWKLCDGNHSIEDIRQSVSRETGSPVTDDLVWLALESFKKEELLENGSAMPPAFNGLSRRDVIKKIGLGTMVALPVVASLIAPAAAHAQSCLPDGAPCNGTTPCCGGAICEGVCLGTGIPG